MVAVGRWRFYWREEKPEESKELKPREGPFGWVRSLRTQSHAVASLRRLLARHPAADLWRLNDDGVVRLLEQRLAAGRILLYEWVPERGGGERQEESSTAAPAFPLDERRRQAAPASPPPDAALFPEDASLEAIAGVLKQAAESGTPFCEECQKAGRA